MPFTNQFVGFADNPATVPGSALPTLNLSRVFVLTTSSTCSASEAIINGLRGADIEVIQIGSGTCGKPYGFYPTDNCATTYFTIQFSGINNAVSILKNLNIFVLFQYFKLTGFNCKLF